MINYYCPGCHRDVIKVNDTIRTLYNMSKDHDYMCLTCMCSYPNPNKPTSLKQSKLMPITHSPQMIKQTWSQSVYGQSNGYDNCHQVSGKRL